MNNDNIKSKLTNPERISRLVSRMCSGGMPVVIREEKAGMVGIRGSFYQLRDASKTKIIYFNNVSAHGRAKLNKGDIVKVEVIGMPSQVVFRTKVVTILKDGIICLLPKSLVSVERRQNARYSCSKNMMLYCELSVWKASAEDLAASPVCQEYNDVSSWLPILDMSLGGICAQSSFPSFTQVVDDFEMDPKMKLFVPMQKPIEVPVHFRWKRKIKNLIEVPEGSRYQMDYRIGIEFDDPDEDLKVQFKQILRKLSVADAI